MRFAMSAPAIALSVGALVSAGLAIWSEAKGRRRLFRLTKPLATVLIILVAVITSAPVPVAYKTLILAGLGFSLFGDIALLFPEKWFTAGLAAFLAAQVFYVLAFRPGPGHQVPTGLFLPFIFYGLLMFFILAPGLGPLKLPVFVYIAAITIMAAFAAARFVDLGGARPLLAFAGAILFLVSDSVLAYDRFAKKIGPAQIIILGTYFPAQLLIALSI
jgi:uncharacterized membrane protein YhhN